MKNKLYAKLVGNYLQLDCKFPLNLHNKCRLSMGMSPIILLARVEGRVHTNLKTLLLFTQPHVVPNPQRQKQTFL